MTHDSKFPDSAEASDARTDRAIEALQYEEQAGLGYRRRERGPVGDPYAGDGPERAQVDRDPSNAELWAGLVAGFGVVFGIASILYKPLLMAVLSAFLLILGSLGDGAPARIAKVGLWIALGGFMIGMSLSMFVTHKPIW